MGNIESSEEPNDAIAKTCAKYVLGYIQEKEKEEDSEKFGVLGKMVGDMCTEEMKVELAKGKSMLDSIVDAMDAVFRHMGVRNPVRELMEEITLLQEENQRLKDVETKYRQLVRDMDHYRPGEEGYLSAQKTYEDQVQTLSDTSSKMEEEENEQEKKEKEANGGKWNTSDLYAMLKVLHVHYPIENASEYRKRVVEISSAMEYKRMYPRYNFLVQEGYINANDSCKITEKGLDFIKDYERCCHSLQDVL
jgi:predicted transcriptional regulator